MLSSLFYAWDISEEMIAPLGWITTDAIIYSGKFVESFISHSVNT